MANVSSAAGARAASPVGALLQEWRRRRGMSQLALASEAGVSTRHLCFVETGRAKPSRDMVSLLVEALDVPLRERNGFLLAAGYAPVYAETDLSAAELEPARAALETILRHQEPHPAVVLDRHWTVLRMNVAATRLFAWLLEGTPPLPGPPNLVRTMLHPSGVRAFVEDWDQVAAHLVHRVRREAMGGVPDARSQNLLDEVLALVPRGVAHAPDRPLTPVLPIAFVKDGDRLSYFSTVTTLGTPQDITLQEIRIECLFPIDAETVTVATQRLGA